MIEEESERERLGKFLQSINILENMPRIHKDIPSNYVGKQVVMEIGGTGTNLSSGLLEQYDGRFVLIKDYKKHYEPLSRILDKTAFISPGCDLTNDKSIDYSLPSLTININQIASIMTLDNLIETRRKLLEK